MAAIGTPQTERAIIMASCCVATAAGLAAADAIVIRLLAGEVHPFVIVLFRSVFGLAAVAPFIIARPHVLKTGYRFQHVARAALKIGALVCFFLAFAAAPLADAMSIMFMTPIFLMLGSWAWLGEKLTPARIFALVAGFAGALIIIRPGSEHEMSPALLFALAGAAQLAIVQLMLKRMSDRDSTDTLVAWNLIATVPLAVIPALLFWTTPDLRAFGLLALQGVMGAANMALMTKAFSIADASHIAPMDFLRLPIVAILAWLMFGEVVEVSTWVGALVIFSATMLTVGGSRFRRRAQESV
jgi:drug/metabolite transporter (DMT)-like permease